MIEYRLSADFLNARLKCIPLRMSRMIFRICLRLFAFYIKLRSAQKKQAKISARINRLKKYYTKPCELFARLVEGVYLDKEWVCALAPYTSGRFFNLLENGCYGELAEVFKLCRTYPHNV